MDDEICGFCNQSYLSDPEGYCRHEDEHMRRQRDATRAELKTAFRWIPVEERLPAEHELVLGTNANAAERNYYLVYRYVHNGASFWEDGEFERTVTHWLPIPPFNSVS